MIYIPHKVCTSSNDTHGGDCLYSILSHQCLVGLLINNFVGVKAVETIVFLSVRVKPDLVIRGIFGETHGLPEELGCGSSESFSGDVTCMSPIELP